MEEATAREMERHLQQMRLKVIETKGGKGVEGLRPLPESLLNQKIKKKKERGEKAS